MASDNHNDSHIPPDIDADNNSGNDNKLDNNHLSDQDNGLADTADLLARLSQPLDIDEFAFAWLELQCRTLGNVSAAVLLIRDEGANTFKPVAKHPLEARVDTLAEVAYGVIDEECGLLLPLEGENKRPGYAVAYPVHVDQQLLGIVALEVNVSEPQALQGIMGQLQWSVGWIALYVSSQSVAGIRAESFSNRRALAVFSKVQAQHEFAAACQSLVTAIATELDCDRVSIGFPTGAANHQTIKVQAVSHNAQFGKKMALVTAISHAMEEALTLGRDIVLPQRDSSVTTPDHGALMAEQGSLSVVSIPVFVSDSFRCVITLEKGHGELIDVDKVDFVKAIAVLCSPTLEDIQAAQRSLPKIIADKIRLQFERLIGPNYIGRKIIAFITFILLIFFIFAKGTYRISAETELEGIVQRVMAAPFNGYIASAQVRAGDLVKAGEVVARLKDEELRLERQKWLSERSQYRHEYNQAFSKAERAVVSINRARMNQASAELALAEQKLQRTNIVAPFDGVIISGDLSQRLGGFVEQGEVLFEIAPLDNYRVVLFVEDKRIGDVALGQQGNLVLSSLPNQKFQFQIKSITPITEARDGANYFRVEAELVQAQLLEGGERLRPGMQGIGKIEVDQRRLISIWTRSFTEWLSLQIWKWLP